MKEIDFQVGKRYKVISRNEGCNHDFEYGSEVLVVEIGIDRIRCRGRSRYGNFSTFDWVDRSALDTIKRKMKRNEN